MRSRALARPLEALKVNSGTGPDGLATRVLKTCARQLFPPRKIKPAHPGAGLLAFKLNYSLAGALVQTQARVRPAKLPRQKPDNTSAQSG